MKFEYSPGLLGYGPAGADGSDGIQGMSIYFTDYDTVFNQFDIELAIENNYVLWSTVAPGTALPAGKTYISGDLFVNPQGTIYIIDASNDTYSLSGSKLSKTDYFITDNSITTNGFVRWYNKVSSSERYLIDNTNNVVTTLYNYADNSIYGISLKNYNRIEYTNRIDGSFNAFTLYSCGENTDTDDHQSLAILYDSFLDTFRIGNAAVVTDGTPNNFRNVSLIFDISSLIYNRPNAFNINTDPQTVLTNSQIEAYSLYSPHFVSNPTYFQWNDTSTSFITLRWKLSDFTIDTSFGSVTGDLYFYKQPSITYKITDSSEGSSLVFHNVNHTGIINITKLTPGTTYQYYMLLKRNGWERASDINIVSTPTS